MPLEISEIGVHIAIGHTPAPTAAPTPVATSGAAPADPMTPARVEAIVQASVQEVLRTLRLREER